MNRTQRTGLIVLLLAALLSACQARFPTGKFAAEAAPGGAAGDVRTLIFFPDGRWEGYLGGNLLTFGAYTTDGERVTFETDFQCHDAGYAQAAGYAWSYADDALRFAPAGDEPCPLRADLLSGDFRKTQ